jgi:hypothetical protein
MIRQFVSYRFLLKTRFLELFILNLLILIKEYLDDVIDPKMKLIL